MKRAFRYVAQQNAFQVLLEFAKTLYFAGRAPLAAGILLRAIERYPSEWKLRLELVHQCVSPFPWFKGSFTAGCFAPRGF